MASPLKPQRLKVVILRKRNQAILIRLTDNEKNHLQRQAANAGLKMEPFIRKLIMGVNISPRPPSNIVNLIREVNRIGNNINQIAKKVNATNESITSRELNWIKQSINQIRNEETELWQQIRQRSMD